MDKRIDGKPESISQFAQVDVTKTRLMDLMTECI